MKFKVRYRRFLQEDIDCEVEAESKKDAMESVKRRAETDDVKDLMYVSARVLMMTEVQETRENEDIGVR